MMPPPETKSPRFHFALPRLFALVTGGNTEPTETNWLEANIVGAAVMLISYLSFRRCISSGHSSITRELLWAIPLVLAAWVFWLCALYLGSLVIHWLREIGLLAGVSNAAVQSVSVAIITTGFALQLIRGWTSIIGWLWLGAVCANQLAALLLALSSRSRDAK